VNTKIFSPEPVRIMDLRGTYKGGGGPDKTILNSAARHDPSRVYVLVTYLRRKDDKEFDIHLKASKLGIHYVDVYDESLLDFKCLSRLSALIREHNITLLHAHDDKTLFYGWLLKFFNPRLVIMYTCHSHSRYTRSDFGNCLSYYKFLMRTKIRIFLMKRYRSPVISVSENTRERLVAHGMSPIDIEVIYNGIDVDYWKKERGEAVIRHELHIPSKGFVVGTVARITYDKDLPTFYEVARRVSEKVPDVTFVIVGDGYGNELEEAKAKVRQLGLDNVIKFTGHRSNLLDIYASFDVFLMTSLTEGLPNTALEAMSMNIPVVSTSVGGVPELVVHNKTGFLSDVHDARGLSEQVISLLKNEQQRAEFALSARQRIEKYFSFALRVRKMEGYYERFNRNGSEMSVTAVRGSE